MDYEKLFAKDKRDCETCAYRNRLPTTTPCDTCIKHHAETNVYKSYRSPKGGVM